MSEDDARREVRRAVQEAGGRVAFAKAAKLDAGTLGDFLDGNRWPQDRTMTKIEQALGKPVGWITDLREGRGGRPELTAEDAVIAAILADPNLLPEAKTHLVNQYGLLLRIQGTPAEQQAATTTRHLALLDQALDQQQEDARPKRPT